MHQRVYAQKADRTDVTAEQIASQADKSCPNGHKLHRYAAPHYEHTCDVCETPVPFGAFMKRYQECDYKMCCAALMKHAKEPTATTDGPAASLMGYDLPTMKQFFLLHVATGTAGLGGNAAGSASTCAEEDAGA